MSRRFQSAGRATTSRRAMGHATITTMLYAHLTTRRQREQLADYLKQETEVRYVGPALMPA